MVHGRRYGPLKHLFRFDLSLGAGRLTFLVVGVETNHCGYDG